MLSVSVCFTDRKEAEAPHDWVSVSTLVSHMEYFAQPVGLVITCQKPEKSSISLNGISPKVTLPQVPSTQLCGSGRGEDRRQRGAS